MASPPASRIARAPAEQQLLPDEILEDIFLLLDSGSGYELARASATCRAFRRVATGRRFLRRFLSLHPPPIVGLISLEQNQRFYAAELPHQSAPVVRAVVQAGDFTFSFLPGASHPNSRWIPCDVRDGRVLLSRESTDASTFLELVVCDPLYRRYVQIPPIPGDVVPCIPLVEMKSEPFLAPADENESEEDSNFRVIYNWLSDYKVVSFIFSAATRKWCCATSFSFVSARLILRPKHLVRYYARSCFYWVHRYEKYMLMLDPCEMKFSLILHDKDRSKYDPVEGLAVIDVAEDRLGLLTLDGGTLELFTKTCQNNCVGAEEWHHDKFIPLPKEPGYKYFIIGAAEGYLHLRGSHCVGLYGIERGEIHYFTMNLQTLILERLCVLNRRFEHGIPYASFPPPLAPPSL